MKKKLFMVLWIISLVLVFSGTTKAIEVQEGPLLFKTYNWEVGTTYLGGTSGMTYFRTTTSSYYKSDGTLVTYTGAADQGLFSDLTIVKDPSLNVGEDTWGLLEVRQLELGEVLLGGNIGNPIGPKTPAEIYWNPGDKGKWIRGVLWGLQDQAVEWIVADFVRIYSDNLQFNLYEMDKSTYNPQAAGNPTPADRDKTKPDEFAPAGWDPWAKDTSGNLLMQGTGSWFRYSGDLDDPDGSFIPKGETSLYLDVDPAAGQWGAKFQNWWSDPAGVERSDIWQTWNIGAPVPFENGWIGSEDSGRAFIAEPEEELQCRVTGGGNDTFTDEGDGPLNNKLAKGESDDNGCRYTFGGQAGAPTGCQPQPWGNWTHTHHSGMDASFTFHAGTASAPEGTEIDWIECSDPPCCLPARPAPNKQIDFGGVGTFKNVRLKNGSDLSWMQKNTLYEFYVHIEDLGEPGKGGKVDPPADFCPPTGSAGVTANCDCPDFYWITIFNPDGDDYQVYGYIKGGNLQIHPALACK